MKRSSAVGCAVVFGALYLGANIALGTPPHFDDGAGAGRTWLISHASHVRLAVWLLVLGLPVVSGYAAAVRGALPPFWRDVFLVGAIAFVVQTAVEATVLGALAADPAAVPAASTGLLLHLSDYWGPVLTSATLPMLVALAAVGIRAPGWPRWLAPVAGIAAVEQLVETTTVFGRSGFIAPGGGMNVGLGAGLTALALIAGAVAVSARAARPAAASA